MGIYVGNAMKERADVDTFNFYMKKFEKTNECVFCSDWQLWKQYGKDYKRYTLNVEILVPVTAEDEIDRLKSEIAQLKAKLEESRNDQR